MNTNPTKTILMMIDDDIEQYSNLELTALRYYGTELDVEMVLAEKVSKIIDELPRLLMNFPNAQIHAIFDYNMSLNEKGEQKPTEMLFYDKRFQQFMQNGGIIIIYTGYPEQVIQSSVIINANKNTNLVLLLAEKAGVQMEDVFRLLTGVPYEEIPEFKKFAKKHGYNAKKIINSLRMSA
ncbi:MAG: hypothetical protein HQK77_03760 [Desulfobacterales bacterium]|nr:hypothetical protein [Desulfobacterales bacterium]